MSLGSDRALSSSSLENLARTWAWIETQNYELHSIQGSNKAEDIIIQVT